MSEGDAVSSWSETGYVFKIRDVSCAFAGAMKTVNEAIESKETDNAGRRLANIVRSMNKSIDDGAYRQFSSLIEECVTCRIGMFGIQRHTEAGIL